jgi:Cdc6-like AAA superfamily ATPase
VASTGPQNGPGSLLAVSTSALEAVVAGYIDDLGGALSEAAEGIEGIDASRFPTDVTNEAFNLTAAMVDADHRHTDDELNALIDVFGPRLDDTSLLLATPGTLRGSSLVAGRVAWLEQDSELFKVLLAADARRGSSLADLYYERTMDVAHVVASLDVVPSRDELAAIARLRTRLLAGLRRRHDDGRSFVPPAPSAAPGAAGAAASTGTPGAPTAPELPAKRPLEELLAELDDLIGLESVKDRVHLVADFLRVQQLRAERDLPRIETSHHLVFTGNPGTGKTTVARLLAQIFRTLGVVDRGHLVEVDRSSLVAGYVGQTAPQVTSTFDRADEGMLFIDEAYTLMRGGENDFGREAIDQIVKLMEDRRDRVVLVVAGYPVEMEQLLSTNPGLRSRFPTTIEFPDYTTDELVRIAGSMGDKQRYHLTESATAKLRSLLDGVPREKGFGNARLARNIYEAAVNRHATRVVTLDQPSDEALTTLDAVDIPDSVTDIDRPPRRREVAGPGSSGDEAQP